MVSTQGSIGTSPLQLDLALKICSPKFTSCGMLIVIVSVYNPAASPGAITKLSTRTSSSVKSKSSL